jgi:fibronectin-binding autotransporter adhesin
MKSRNVLIGLIFLALVLLLARVPNAFPNGGATLTINSNTQMDQLDVESSATVDVNNHTLTVGTGGIDIKSGGTLLGDGTINDAGGWTTTGTFTHQNGTVVFNGSAAQAITNATTFYNLTITNTAGTPSASADVETTAAVTVANTLSITDGWFTPYTGSAFKDVAVADSKGYLVPGVNMSVSGNWTNGGTFTAGSGTVTFNGTSTVISGGTGSTQDFNNVVLNGTSVTLATNAIKIGGTLTLTSGFLSLAGQNMEVTGTYSCADVASLKIKGNETVTLTAGMDTDTGKLVYLSPGANINVLTSTFTTVNDVEFDDGGGTAYTFTLGANATVNGLLTVTDGTFALSDKTLALNEGMTIAATGTVTGGSTTITLADSQTVTNNGTWSSAGTGTFVCSGSATFAGSNGISFYHFTSDPAAGETLTFADGVTYTFGGLLTLTGAGSGASILNIAKSGDGDNAVLSKNGTSSVEYVAVNGVNGVVDKIITASNSYAAGGTPLYWQFGTGTATEGGNWNTAGTWGSGHVPDSADDVTISHNVTLNTDTTVNSLNVTANTLSLFDGDTSHTLTVTESVTVGGTLNVGIGVLTAGGASDINGTLTISTGSYTANDSFDATGGNVTFTGAGTLNVAGTIACGGLGTFTKATGCTVDYKLNGAQSVSAVDYYHLKLSTGGTKTLCGHLTGDTDIDGNLTIASSVTFDVTDENNYNIEIAGNWTNDWVFTAREGAVTFDGSEDSILVPGGSSFYALVLNKDASGDKLSPQTSATLTVNSALTITKGTFNLANGGASDADVSLSLGGALSIGANGLWTKSNDTTPKKVTFTGDTCTLTDSSTGGPQNLGHVVVD